MKSLLTLVLGMYVGWNSLQPAPAKELQSWVVYSVMQLISRNAIAPTGNERTPAIEQHQNPDKPGALIPVNCEMPPLDSRCDGYAPLVPLPGKATTNKTKEDTIEPDDLIDWHIWIWVV